VKPSSWNSLSNYRKEVRKSLAVKSNNEKNLFGLNTKKVGDFFFFRNKRRRNRKTGFKICSSLQA
jgi:hypothetical protein